VRLVAGRFQNWLATLPSTNLQTFVGLALSTVAVLVLLAAILMGRQLQEGVVNSLLFFIGALLGLSVGQFTAKRATQRVDVMNANAAIESNTAVRTTTTKKEKTETTETVPGPSSEEGA
jgi:nitrogen fixation/metabolism regulation signal transduction histidine kinase